MIAMSYAVRGLYPHGKANKLKLSSSGLKGTKEKAITFGYYNIEKNLIHINIYDNVNVQVVKGTLAHEIHHAWENFKHNNLCKLYPKTQNEPPRMKELLSKLEGKTQYYEPGLNLSNAEFLLFRFIFNIEDYKQENKHKELVVRTTQSIAHLTGLRSNGNEEIISEEKAISKTKGFLPKLFTFFTEELAEMKKWNAAVERRFSVGAPAQAENLMTSGQHNIQHAKHYSSISHFAFQEDKLFSTSP